LRLSARGWSCRVTVWRPVADVKLRSRENKNRDTKTKKASFWLAFLGGSEERTTRCETLL